MKWIGVLDCNNFFVSCERLFRPDLQTVPTIVLSSNDGCVVARSKEVKDMGVPMGVPYFKVREELEKAGTTVFSSNFPLYRDISARVMTVLREEVDVVEQYSVDEAFFELDMNPETVPDALEHIKYVVEQRVGVPVSVGAAKTKTIAKYASEVGKQGAGVSFMYGAAWNEAAKTLPVHEIWGVGKRTSMKLKENGIETVSEFCTADPACIDRLFGIGGLRMRDELSERPVHHIGSGRSMQKSIMSTRSFKSETKDRSVVEDALAYHVAHVAEELREMGKKAQCIRVIALTNRHGDWFLRSGSNESLLPYPSNDTRVILREALRLLRAIYDPEVPYKKTGVTVGMLSDTNVEQMDLFDTHTEQEKDSVLMDTIDTLNRHFGSETVTIGRCSAGEKWKASKAHVSPSYTTNWSEIAEIRA